MRSPSRFLVKVEPEMLLRRVIDGHLEEAGIEAFQARRKLTDSLLCEVLGRFSDRLFRLCGYATVRADTVISASLVIDDAVKRHIARRAVEFAANGFIGHGRNSHEASPATLH